MPFEDPIFSDKNEVKSKPIKFGKIGDAFKGTLLSIKTVEVFDEKAGGKVPKKVYEFSAHAGAFHDMDPVSFAPLDEETVVVAGDIYVLWSRGKRFDDDMKRAKPGTIVGFRYTGNTEPKPGRRPGKIVKTYIGGVDPNYMGESAEDLARDFGGEVVEPATPDFSK